MLKLKNCLHFLNCLILTDCQNCVLGWEEWSSCSNGKRSRSQRIETEAFGGGTPCPETMGFEEEGKF